MTGIASLILDPNYGTIEGFEALIKKNKLNDRCGYIEGDGKQMAPVLTQLLDTIWQLTQHLNERYLLTIDDRVDSCEFGTFIGNCEKHRKDLSF